ncbi:MAG TPA: hypothetical protein VFM10_03715 [Terriglobales bacterium]|jgi:Mrp family chromosome partitioning ATPase|nr:hypothetical protein [Terriglobales bacterium]
MSRNFEVLRRLEQEQSSRDGNNVEAPFRSRPFPSVKADAELPRTNARLTAAVNKLVQRIFVLPGVGAPRAVAFASIENRAEPDFIAARAAEVLASQSRLSVCIVDANFENPSVHECFGIANTEGLSDSLADSMPAVEFGHRVPGLELVVIPTGRVGPNTERQAASDKAAQRITELRTQFDFVLVNAPPLRSAGPALFLGRLSDGLVMIVEAHSTKRDIAMVVKEELERAHVRLLGAVLNNRTYPIPQRLYSRL